MCPRALQEELKSALKSPAVVFIGCHSNLMLKQMFIFAYIKSNLTVKSVCVCVRARMCMCVECVYACMCVLNDGPRLK